MFSIIFPSITSIRSIWEIYKRIIRKPEDLQGLKIRVVGSPIFIDIYRQMGADPVNMNWGDAITAFQQDVVDGQENPDLFRLLEYVLGELDRGLVCDSELSILFQLRFMKLAGFAPNLSRCCVCQMATDRGTEDKIAFDLVKGGLVCKRCADGCAGRIWLSKGTVKQLLWFLNGDLEKAARIRFNGQAIEEGLRLLEAFVPYHLGREPKSLKVLRQIRPDCI